MNKLMVVVSIMCLFSLLCGQCLASYSVSGTVYYKGTTIVAPNASVTLSSSSGLQSTVLADTFGSFSVYWGGGGVSEIGNTMTLKAAKGIQLGQKVWKASQNTEQKDVEISNMLISGTHLVVTPLPVHHLGTPGGVSVVGNPVVLQTPGPVLNIQNAQVNLMFNGPIVGVDRVEKTAVGDSVSMVSLAGGVQVNVEFNPPRNVPDFPAESFFDVYFEVDFPESDAVLANVTVEDALFNNGEPQMYSGRPSLTELLVGEPEPCQPYFLIDEEDEWNEGLIMEWPQANIIPMTLAEWNDPDFGYMAQWGAHLEDGDPYPPVEFLPPTLYVYPGDDDEGTPEPDDAGLVMTWGDETTPDGEYASAWKFDYGLDPDLTNSIITVTATPPAGINNISLGLQDINGAIRSWHWACGTAAVPSGVPTTITIDTTMTGPNAASPPATGFANNPAFNLTQVQYIIADENGTWVAQQGAVPPGGQISAIWNYWHNLSVTPKLPATGANSKWYVKYSQPPVEVVDESGEPIHGKIIGWDEVSNYNHQPDPIMADDWKCEDDRPITDIHWWGSFKGWTQPHLPPILPIAFRIGVWTDVPATVDMYSHPGQLIWENECRTAVWNFAGYDVDPRIGDADFQENETCFQWAQFLNQDEWFRQEPMADGKPNVYWLSIAPIYGPNVDYADPDFYPWGWKTREHFFNDDAIRITDASQWPPVVGSVWTGGNPVEFPQEVSWDLAFELTTNEPKCPGLTADLNNDCIVSLPDFAIMAQEWLKTSP